MNTLITLAARQENQSALALPWLSLAFLAILILALNRRLSHGVTLAELWRTRFYEVRPIRGIILLVWLALWTLILGAGIGTLRLFGEWMDNTSWLTFWRVLGGLIVLGGAWMITSWWRGMFVALGENRRPTVRVNGITLHSGIDRASFDTLGIERFPNNFCPRQAAEIGLRKRLLIPVVVVILLAVLGVNSEYASTWWFRLFTFPLGILKSSLHLLPDGLGIAMAAASALAGCVLLWKNQSYTLLTFRESLLANIVCTCGLLCGMAMASAPVPKLALALGGAAFAMGFRWIRDIRVASRYRAVKAVYDHIAGEIAKHDTPLEEMQRRDDCRLEPLNEAALVTRISNGCRNAENSDAMVMRNFGRFLNLAEVSHQMTTVAMLRFLTVGRNVSESRRGGTTRPLQNPPVPAWDEDRFPLHAPAGFVNWLDPLGLDESWDRVSVCGNCSGSGRARCHTCGGSGRITRQENGRTVTSTCGGCHGSGVVVCSVCSGLGRVVFGRTLNTHWQRFLPAQTEPGTPLAELFEDAEERVYFRRAIIENRCSSSCNKFSETDGISADLTEQLDKIADAVTVSHDSLAEKVREIHEARFVYRADFQVAGFWTLRIGCRWLRGKVGWFFGKRPEFYFPSMPLSWSYVGAIALLIPLTVCAAPFWMLLVRRFLSFTMSSVEW